VKVPDLRYKEWSRPKIVVNNGGRRKRVDEVMVPSVQGRLGRLYPRARQGRQIQGSTKYSQSNSHFNLHSPISLKSNKSFLDSFASHTVQYPAALNLAYLLSKAARPNGL
jgi:hypothetical protein